MPAAGRRARDRILLSIAPPSDIVLDVAQAADPLKLQAATAKLARMAAGAGAGAGSTDFDAALAAMAPPPASASKPLASSFGLGTTLWQTPSAPQAKGASAYQKFEAVILQNFVQNILPKDENLFGDAASADIVRGMLAEQLATQLAKSGKLGIAKMIAHAHPAAKISTPTDAPPVEPPPPTPMPVASLVD